MNDDDYVWDGAGEPDAFVAGLERGLAPLADEADALLDELEFLDELELPELAEPNSNTNTSATEAVILTLPSVAGPGNWTTVAPEPSTSGSGSGSGSGSASGGRWRLMGVAAAVLLTVSALTLFEASRSGRGGAAMQVGGGAEPLARVELEVEDVAPSVAASRAVVLAELRGLHQPLAGCARDFALALEEPSARLSATLVLGRERVERVDLAEPVETVGPVDPQLRTCFEDALTTWEPEALGAGELRVSIVIRGAGPNE